MVTSGTGGQHMPKKNESTDSPLGYRTEEQLKQAAKEQRRRQELIEQNRKPPSAGVKKIENFWYHYRFATIAAVIGVVLLSLILKDIFFQVRPDVHIVMISEAYVSEQSLDRLTQTMEANSPDLNGDGRVSISMEAITFSPADAAIGEPLAGLEGEDADTATNRAVLAYNTYMKLTTILAEASDLIFLLDEPNYQYLQGMSDSDSASMGEDLDMFRVLEDLPGSTGKALPLSATILADIGREDATVASLAFYFRQLPLTEENEAYIAQCYAFLERMTGGTAG
jgi:hypothetical protein